MLCYGNDSESKGDGTAIRGDCECRSTGDTGTPKVHLKDNYGRGKADQNSTLHHSIADNPCKRQAR